MFLKEFKGKWKITDMDQWEVEPGWFIEFDEKGSGSFQFICVQADMDCRIDDEKLGFTFHGENEGDEIFGRGWALK